MKSLLIVLALIFSLTAQATPDYMKDGVITVTLKDGKSYSFSANDYMVVKRGVVTQKDENQGKTVVITEYLREKDNNISVLGGVSMTRLSSSLNGNLLGVSREYEPDAGIMYQHRFGEGWVFDALGTMRGSVLLGIGQEF